jgi:nickel transport protein
MPRFRLPALAGATALLAPALLATALSPAPAGAHAIQSTLERLDSLSASLDSAPTGAGVIRLATSFSSGQPVAAAQVRLVPPDGGPPLVVGSTDADGRLTFALPRQARPDWELLVDGGPGHRDYLELPSGSSPGLHSARPAGGLLATAHPLSLFALVGSLGLGGLAFRRRG